MKKPTYYLWRDNYSSLEEYTNTKERYKKKGFRVVTFKDGQNDQDIQDIQDGIRSVIKNHIGDSCQLDNNKERV